MSFRMEPVEVDAPEAEAVGTEHAFPYFKYWGKTCGREDGASCHLLAYHALDVAAAGSVYLNSHPFLADLFAQALGLNRSCFIDLACFFLALHDLGKFSSDFQGQAPDLFRRLRGREPQGTRSERHDSLGYVLWTDAIQPIALEKGWIELTGPKRKSQRALKLWVAAVTGHHGQPPSTVYRSHQTQAIKLTRAFAPEDIDAAVCFSRDVRDLFLPDPVVLDAELLGERLKRASWWLAGLTVLCDWIGSNQKWFPCEERARVLPDYWAEVALPRAQEAVVRAGVLPAPTAPPAGLAELFPALAGKPPTPLQALAHRLPLESAPQLLILEDVTGAGKTEAAAILAHRLAAGNAALGAYFALPTMATANAMYRRLSNVYDRFFADGGSPSLVLAHGRRDLDRGFRDSMFEAVAGGYSTYADGELSAGARCAAWLGDHRKKALLADFGVGTVDQALLAALPSKHQSLRLLGLTRKVLVVDEVHACDEYMLSVLRRVITFHTAAGGSTILLSATLPHRTRQALIEAYTLALGGSTPKIEGDDYPLLTHVGAAACNEYPVQTRPEVARSVTVELMHELESADALVLQAVARGECVCWIRNSVDDAIETSRRLRTHLPSGQVRLFHARFALCDRLRIEDAVLKTFGKESTASERHGQVLIATQVVEQSLDLDFDQMITDLAPIDLLIQRAGRLHRHRRDAEGNRSEGPEGRPAPVLRVLTPPAVDEPGSDWLKTLLPRTAAVYTDHFRLWRTARLLADIGCIRMPEDARMLIETVYGDADEPLPAGLQRSASEAEAERAKARSLARQNALDLEEGYQPRSGTLDWWQDMHTPTRLGDASVTLRLARVEDGAVRPWCEADGWRASELSIRAARIAADAPHPAVEQAKASMADQGRWSLVLPLEKVDGTWRGSALNGSGDRVDVTYGAEEGLLFA